MKFRKTRTAARSVYIYRFADGTVAVLHPGEQGVSTEIIDFLHKLDDREVYLKLSITLDTLTARILKLSSDSQS